MRRPNGKYSLGHMSFTLGQIRREIVDLIGENYDVEELFETDGFFSQTTDRLDFIWFFILAFSLQGGHFYHLRRLRRMVHPGTFLYQRLRRAANNLHFWWINQRRETPDPEIEEEMWEEWPDEEEQADQNGTVQLSPDVRQRLVLLFCFTSAFDPTFEGYPRYPKNDIPLPFAAKYFDLS